MLWDQSTTKDYIRSERKLHSISKLFISRVIIPQVMFFLAYLYSAGTRHGNLHPAGWPILLCGPTEEPVLATANVGKNRERFWKKCRWMDRKGRNKEEIPGSKRSMYGYIYTDLLQAIKGEHLSSVFSPEGTSISASAAPHCGIQGTEIRDFIRYNYLTFTE